MADTDFNITIRTIADTTGIKLTTEQLKALKIAALQGNKEAIASLQQLTNAQKQASAAGAGNIAQLGSLVGTITGVGLAGGILQFVNGLKQASEEIAKVADGLDRQGAELVKHVQLYSEQARFAKDESDVLKISEGTLKEIENLKTTFNELSQKELGYSEQISDELQKQMLARQRAAGMGDYEAARQENLNTAFEQLQTARQKAMDEVLAAEEAQNQTYEEKEATLNRLIAAEEERKRIALDTTDAEGYTKATNALSKLRLELDAVIRLEAQRRTQQSREDQETEASKQSDIDFDAGRKEKAVSQTVQNILGADPQVQAILKNEQAARIAQQEGRGKDADLYTKSAEAFKRGATPQQLKQVGKAQADPNLTTAMDRVAEKIIRGMKDIWQ